MAVHRPVGQARSLSHLPPAGKEVDRPAMAHGSPDLKEGSHTLLRRERGKPNNGLTAPFLEDEHPVGTGNSLCLFQRAQALVTSCASESILTDQRTTSTYLVSR